MKPSRSRYYGRALRAYSVSELLIGLLVFSILLGVLYSFSRLAENRFRRERKLFDIQRAENKVIRRIKKVFDNRISAVSNDALLGTLCFTSVYLSNDTLECMECVLSNTSDGLAIYTSNEEPELFGEIHYTYFTNDTEAKESDGSAIGEFLSRLELVRTNGSRVCDLFAEPRFDAE